LSFSFSSACVIEIVHAETYTLILSWGADGGALAGNTPDIAVDNAGNVFVIVPGYHSQVKKFDGSGNLLIQWGSTGDDDGQFVYPRGLGVDSEGNVYVADTLNNRIQKFSNDGVFLDKWNSQSSIPTDVAVDNDGNIYEAYYPNHIAIDSHGVVHYSNGNGGIAIDSDDNIFKSSGDITGGIVEKFSSDGTPLATWDCGSLPYGVAVDHNGYVYVIRHPSGLVQKFANLPDGLNVIPEVPLGTLLLSISMVIATVVFTGFRRFQRFKQLYKSYSLHH
jgi:tripartite motif-containing protein 71